MADLMRAIDIDCKIAFLSAKSYGNSSVSSGKVELEKTLKTSLGEEIENKDIILVEDILDTAATLYAVKEKYRSCLPLPLRYVHLLSVILKEKLI